MTGPRTKAGDAVRAVGRKLAVAAREGGLRIAGRAAGLARRILDRRRSAPWSMSLGTRFLLVLVSVATASTIITVVLQNNSLSRDLREAARARLERSSALAAHFVNQHLFAQHERYEAVASTPQILANLEARHAPTILHYATELQRNQGAASILFLGPDTEALAGTGEEQLRKSAREFLVGRSRPEGSPSGAGLSPVSTVFSFDGAAYSLTAVRLGDDSDHFGTLVALEPIGARELTAWSTLCRAKVTISPASATDPLSRVVRPMGDVDLRIATTFDAEQEALANSRTTLIAGGFVGLALAFVASLILSRSLVQPIRAIQSATERIGAGDLQIRLDESRGDEVGDVARAFNLMLESLEQNIRHRVRVENQMSHLAYHDSLTGLGNRRLLKERLGTALEQRRQDTGVGVIFLDLDRFKDINDTLGHTAGDELLVEVAKRLDSCMQTSGMSPGDGNDDVALLARLGGDEFTVLLTDVEQREQIEQIADRILDSLSAPIELRGQEVSLSASLGIALSPEDADDVETLLRGSDMAMFHAKSRGGRSYEFYADSMEEIAAKRLALETRIERALQNDEFHLHYQPKVNLVTNQITGFEALLRWSGDGGEVMGPAEFIPTAEETGAIIPIGEWVLRTAMLQALAWQEQGLPPVRVSVNVSVRQIEHRTDFVHTVEALLEETGLKPSLLDLEITEGALLRQEEEAISLFQKLREMGVSLSLDDFGTGYSSLSYLRRLPIDTLKIDRSFIQGADSNPDDAALVGSIVGMAKVLGLNVVVEGVETRKQRRFLDDLGCDEIQGYLVSKPLAPDQAAEVLRKRRRPWNRSKKAVGTRRSSRRKARGARKTSAGKA